MRWSRFGRDWGAQRVSEERDIFRDLEIVIEDALRDDLTLRADDLRCPPKDKEDTRQMGVQGMILDAELAERIALSQCRALIRKVYDKLNGRAMRGGKVNEDGSVTDFSTEE